MTDLVKPQHRVTQGDLVGDTPNSHLHAAFRTKTDTLCGIISGNYNPNPRHYILQIDPDSPGAIAIVDIACQECRHRVRIFLAELNAKR